MKKTKSKIFLLAIIFVFIYTFLFITDSDWKSNEKFSYYKKLDNNDIEVIVLDPSLNEKTSILIPGNVEVLVSRNFGIYRLKNVWKLGQDEKIGGRLLSDTLTKNFNFPVKNWIFNDQTNVKKIDRIKVIFFERKIKSIDENIINMAEGGYLKKTKLEDGEDGYKLLGPMSPRLTVYFSDQKTSDSKIKLIDKSGRLGTSEKIGEILEVIGGKVVSIEKENTDENMDCEVGGLNSHYVSIINSLFSCKIISEDKFDLYFIFGKKFALRF